MIHTTVKFGHTDILIDHAKKRIYLHIKITLTLIINPLYAGSTYGQIGHVPRAPRLGGSHALRNPPEKKERKGKQKTREQKKKKKKKEGK